MGELQARSGEALSIHGIAVVLACDLDPSCVQVPDRMVAAPVAEFQLIGPGTVGQGDDLMAQAYAEDRHPSPQGPDKFDDLGHVFRVPGTVGEEQPVGMQGQHLIRLGIIGQHGHIASPGVQ